MGKAGKWIRNFLMGKREDKAKVIGAAETVEETVVVAAAAATPKVKRRWSFKRPPTARPITHKSSLSFDSIYMPKQVLLDYEAHQNKVLVPTRMNAHAAAIRIQAFYRSYLVTLSTFYTNFIDLFCVCVCVCVR